MSIQITDMSELGNAIISSSATEITELVDMDTLSHALYIDSTLSLEQASTKPLLQD